MSTTIQDLFTKPVLIFGCGNILMGDDGFGPAVIDHLQENYRLPSHVAALDVGTSIRELLFDLVLMPERPRIIYIVDAVFNSEHLPGEIFETDIARIPSIKVNDFSLHQFPSVNLLRELQDGAGVRVRVLAVQVGKIPEEIGQGLTEPVRAAVPRASGWLFKEIEEMP
ncbi:MAG: hydrogenase maturation protease [Syntrophobacteraceae bacterium]